MVHGDCSSRGCYAMTDEQIAEIYSLGRESFFGGQKAFQFQAYPFHMTPLNMAKHRNNPNMAFWKMIKQGYDLFEITHQEPKVDFCEKHYVFNAIRAPNATRDPVFQASAKCPAYAMADDVVDALHQKQEDEQAEFNKLVAKGTPMAKLNSGIDGGMNQIFASHVQGGNTGLSEGGEGQSLSLVSFSRAPGTIPGHVNPPRDPSSDVGGGFSFAAAPATQPAAPAAAPATRVATAAPAAATPAAQQAPESDSFFASLGRKMGFSSSASADTTATTPPPSAPAKPKVAEKRPEPKPKAETRQAAVRPPFKPSITESEPQQAAQAPAAPQPKEALVSGAQPIVQSNSFDSRFSAVK
jgi:hypothetical protein